MPGPSDISTHGHRDSVLRSHRWRPGGGPAVPVPEELAASHARYFGAAGRQWVATLPGLAAEVVERWRLRLDGPAAYGAVALVLPVRCPDGAPAALKLQPVDDETGGEAVALTSWAGHGAVRLLAHDPASGAMLLERLDASRPLAVLEDDSAAVGVIAELLVRLNAVSAPTGLRRLPDVAAATLAGTPLAVSRAADPDERRLLLGCADRLREVLADPVEDRLLHWDLHYDNVLATLHGPRTWVAIDPKPLSGDSGFELLPALWNRWDVIVASGDRSGALLRRFDLMTECLHLDRRRAAIWTAARVLQNAVWDLARFGRSRVEPAHRLIAEVVLGARARSD